MKIKRDRQIDSCGMKQVYYAVLLESSESRQKANGSILVGTRQSG